MLARAADRGSIPTPKRASCSDKAMAWNAKGGTGHGVLTFLALLERESWKKQGK